MTRAAIERWCQEPECYRPAHSGASRCAGHAKQYERTGKTRPLREAYGSLRERVSKHILDYTDAIDEKSAAKAWDSLEHVLRTWAKDIHQRRAGEARWQGTKAKERREIMRKLSALGHAARGHLPSRARQRRASR